MTVRKLVEKYKKLVKQNKDLNFILWEQKCKRINRKRK